ncbi:MAG: hypothetical protein IKS34_04280 [Clostridia bacterium]|nr:hypothetical protein [Clostridia bacterium]
MIQILLSFSFLPSLYSFSREKAREEVPIIILKQAFNLFKEVLDKQTQRLYNEFENKNERGMT